MVFLGVIIYANSLQAPFMFDDKNSITDSKIIGEIGYFIHPSHAEQFTGPGEYPMLVKRYVSLLSLALNYHFNGLDTTGYHIINIIIHILNALLVYALVILTFRTPFMKRSRIAPYAPRAALLAGALFVAHPVQTEAVTYIVQRMASLATLFYLASLVSYIRSRLSGGKLEKIVFYLLALVCAALGMKSKEIAFTLPLAIALYEWAFFEGPLRKRFMLWLPLGLTMLIIPVTQLALRKGGLGAAMSIGAVNMPRWHYLMTESRVLITYLRLLVAPVGQNLMYDYPIYRSLLDPNVLLSGLFHLGMVGLSIYLYRRSRRGEPALRLLAFGIWWFYLALAVESTLVPLHPIYEHRLYLPSVGVFMAVAAGGILAYEGLKSKKWRRTVAIGMAVVPLVLGGMAIARNSVWKSEVSLWKNVVEKAPLSLFTHYNLALAYRKAGQYKKAIEHYRIALTLPFLPERTKSAKDYYAEIYLHLGDNYNVMGEQDQALDAYLTSVQKEPEGPNAATALNNIGVIYLSSRKYAEAANTFIRAIKLSPDKGYLHYNLGTAYYYLGMKKDAVKALRNALQFDPNIKEAKNLLNRILTEKQ
jgi:tetratricopeptide (TPR) repeat protein